MKPLDEDGQLSEDDDEGSDLSMEEDEEDEIDNAPEEEEDEKDNTDKIPTKKQVKTGRGTSGNENSSKKKKVKRNESSIVKVDCDTSGDIDGDSDVELNEAELEFLSGKEVGNQEESNEEDDDEWVTEHEETVCVSDIETNSPKLKTTPRKHKSKSDVSVKTGFADYIEDNEGIDSGKSGAVLKGKGKVNKYKKASSGTCNVADSTPYKPAGLSGKMELKMLMTQIVGFFVGASLQIYYS